MMTVQICPNCKRENTGDAQKCIQCGTTLADRASETARVVDFVVGVKQPEAITPPDLRPGVLALYVMGEKGPILVEGQKTVTLGRIVFGEPSPTVDLTDYHGRLLGVSRHHAAIHFLDNSFTIEDLSSSNGTWVNDKRLSPHQLTPLHNGDLIRLGQLVLLVHFQEAVPAGIQESNGEEKRKTPTRPLDVGTDIHALTVTVVGRPGRVEIRPDGVMTTMLYRPEPDSLPESAPTLFQTSRFYTIYIPTKLWKKVETSLNDPHDQLIVEGTCAYDTEAGRIAILATHVSSKHLEAVRARHLSRQHRRQEHLLKLNQKLRRS